MGIDVSPGLHEGVVIDVDEADAGVCQAQFRGGSILSGLFYVVEDDEMFFVIEEYAGKGHGFDQVLEAKFQFQSFEADPFGGFADREQAYAFFCYKGDPSEVFHREGSAIMVRDHPQTAYAAVVAIQLLEKFEPHGRMFLTFVSVVFTGRLTGSIGAGLVRGLATKAVDTETI